MQTMEQQTVRLTQRGKAAVLISRLADLVPTLDADDCQALAPYAVDLLSVVSHLTEGEPQDA